MPRKARVKSPEAIYHIICRSISEILLFRDDEDKVKYLTLLKKFVERFKCCIYAYCLMDTHLHLHFDPRGFDVSSFMRSLNSAYVWYYNNRYKRHGPLFQDRFESRILDSDEYNLAVSAYIHNNAKDIEGYSGKEHLYPFSSYSIYLGLRKDSLELVDTSFIYSLFGTREIGSFIRKYNEFVLHQRDIGCMKEIINKLPKMVEYEYRSGRTVILRDKPPAQIMSYISDKLLRSEKICTSTHSKCRAKNYRAFCAYALKALCGLGYREVCQNVYNITISGCARLCNRGYDLVSKNKEYIDIFNHLIMMKAV